MKTKTIKSTKKAKVNKDIYDVNVIIGPSKFNSKGETVADAISKLEIKNCKGKSIIVVTKDGASKERILSPNLTYRLFSSFGLTKEVALKNVSNLF